MRAVLADGDFGTASAYNLGMELAGMVVALFASGYILGVWAACLVLKQPQNAYEDGAPASHTGAPARAVRVETAP